jgi:LEA14-like dessication related protein
MKNFALALLALPIFALTTGCSGPKAPSFEKLKHLKISESSNGIITLTADALYHNPNSVGGMLTHSDIKLYIDAVEISHITQDHAIAVPSAQDFDVPVSMVVNLQKILEENEGFLKNTIKRFLTKKMEVQYVGTVTIQIMNIEFDIPVDYTENVSFGLNFKETE